MTVNPIFDQLEDEALRAAREVGGWFHRESLDGQRALEQWRAIASQAPAAATATVEAAPAAQPPEEDMSLLDTIKTHVADDVAALEAKLEGLDEEALGVLKSVTANPEAAGVLKDLAGLAGVVGIPEGAITGVAAGLKTLLSLYAQPAAPEAAPAPAAA